MSPRIPDTHAEAWALLPWVANGRISTAEREWVEAHVSSCAECRAELAAQRMVATQMNRNATPEAGNEEQRSFNKLWARIEASESAAAQVDSQMQGVAVGIANGRPQPSRGSRPVRWLVAAVVLQGFGLALLGVNSLRGTPPLGEIITVTDVPAQRLNAPAVRLAFAPETSIGTINTLLTHQGLSFVAGPGASGNFTAELSANAVASGASANSVAAVMSKDPNVTFAQPVAH